MRFAFPCLFNRDYAPTRAVTFVSDERSGPWFEVQPGATIPAGTLVGLFSGHIFLGAGVRGTRTISIPPAAAAAAAWRLAVDGAARSSRFPSAVVAALYSHPCSEATVTGSCWHDGPVPCLLAHTVRDLRPTDRLAWIS
jgi:hypothetical protein